jgi:hypothetical protein
VSDRRLGSAAMLTAALLGLTGIAGWVLVHRRAGAVERPRYVFVNETDDHVHDLAFKMSLKFAEKRSSIENALIVLKRLPPGRTIEQVAVDLFGRWQIGRNRGGRGILYLYSEQETLLKIEVSYGLEALFPDAFCRQMKEAAKTYMLSEIPQDFVSELLITMNLRATKGTAAADGSWRPPAWLEETRLSGGAGAKATGYRKRLEDYQAAVRRLALSELDEFEPASDPEDTMRRYLRSLELGLGEPQLPLLTEGSQVFRVIVPRSEAQQLRVFHFYARAMPYRLLRLDAWGLAAFRPGTPNLPIVLRRAAGGRWFVDEPKAWTYFHRYEDGVDFFPQHGDLLFLPALRRIGQPNAQNPIYQNRVRTAAPHPYPFSLVGAVAEQERAIRERPGDARPYASAGELYLFEVNWISRSLEMFERAAAIASDRLDYQW